MGKSGAGGNKAVRMAQKQDAADEKDRKARMVAESEAASQWEEGTKKKGRRYVTAIQTDNSLAMNVKTFVRPSN